MICMCQVNLADLFNLGTMNKQLLIMDLQIFWTQRSQVHQRSHPLSHIVRLCKSKPVEKEQVGKQVEGLGVRMSTLI